MILSSKTVADLLSPVPQPVLTWFAPAEPTPGSPGVNSRAERIELSGPVARRWLAKTDNFMADEFPFGAATFSVQMPAHWRAPFWILAGWLRGLALVEPASAPELDLVVSNDLNLLEALQNDLGPDVLVAQPLDSYAFAWDGDLPFGITDGTADIMAFGDEVESAYTAPAESLLASPEAGFADDIALSDPRVARPTLGDLGEIDWVGTSALAGQRTLLTTSNPALATAQALQVWLSGGTVVWAPGRDDAERIVQEEGVTLCARH